MTFASVPALRAAAPELAAEWEPRLASTAYDPGLRPPAGKGGALCGMAMTERQGGSDVRANETRAEPLGRRRTLLTGDKWFCSAPMCDAFLVLAQAPDGLTCFLLPRVLDDGTRNGFRIDRLKDKLGNRSNASAEIRLEDAGRAPRRRGGPRRRDDHRDGRPHAARLRARLDRAHAPRRRRGDPPRCAPRRVRPAARRAAADAERARRPLPRRGGGDRDRDAPRAGLRRGRPRVPARSRPRSRSTGSARRRRRSSPRRSSASGATATSRSRACRASTARARSTRSGKARATSTASTSSARSGASRRAWRRSGPSSTSPTARTTTSTRRSPGSAASSTPPTRAAARRLVERLALCLQGSLLVRHAPAEVADAFCATRLGGEGGRAYGTLPPGVDAAAIVERHRPRVG